MLHYNNIPEGQQQNRVGPNGKRQIGCKTTDKDRNTSHGDTVNQSKLQPLRREAYRIIRSKKTTQRKATQQNLDVILEVLQRQDGHETSEQEIWISLKSKDLRKNVADFLWKCVPNAHRCGVFWKNIPGYKDRVNCTYCGEPETMKHIMIECQAPGRDVVWDLVGSIWSRKQADWTRPCYEEILAVGLQQWLALKKDTVLGTWRGTLADEHALPDDWTGVNRVLVGIAPFDDGAPHWQVMAVRKGIFFPGLHNRGHPLTGWSHGSDQLSDAMDRKSPPKKKQENSSSCPLQYIHSGCCCIISLVLSRGPPDEVVIIKSTVREATVIQPTEFATLGATGRLHWKCFTPTSHKNNTFVPQGPSYRWCSAGAPCNGGVLYTAAQGWDILEEPTQARGADVRNMMSLLAADVNHSHLLDIALEIEASHVRLQGAQLRDNKPLLDLSNRCQTSLNLSTVASFWAMINQIRLACRISDMIAAHPADADKKLTVAAIYRSTYAGYQRKPPAPWTFQDWNTARTKFMRLAAGSVGALVLVAHKELRVKIGSRDGHIAEDLANLMCHPQDTPEGRKVIKTMWYLQQDQPTPM
ncbi:uncharacterized protein C8Q71DRAFT_725813 [Rhodofomes roseus]|uniref:Reverse transcriptase zinc-binding domain-containing protein n=1 Tax=Rhodofomes roseus TaxID=34475 RepID=A0ABQ8K7A0_9APHY|nr:uncharacterized protein C8Q71DRAFT_725813 [Rhodofomes roseus]KAH9833136.1 hypothetical protein C8Q71DRAFT_725813 [Rhodofomes roseus]